MKYYYDENGNLIDTVNPFFEKEGVKILGDYTEIPRPTPEHRFFDGEWILEDKYPLILETNINALLHSLQQLDGKVIRHIEQRELGIDSSLSEEEYIQILKDKQKMREEMDLLKQTLKGLEDAN